MIKFSVICPTYNSALFLSRTVNSVLSQKLAPHELIISDDGSSDNTVNLGRNLALNNISKTKIIVLENKHKGPGAARNSGILAASGDWIAFLDSDLRKPIRCPKEISEKISGL